MKDNWAPAPQNKIDDVHVFRAIWISSTSANLLQRLLYTLSKTRQTALYVRLITLFNC